MYVFLMDRGQLVHLDPSLWTQKVSNLRDLLAEKKIGIPLDRQILLASGGFLLEAGHKISDYGAGLDQTNPIYVFTRTSPDDDAYQTPDVLEVNDGGFPQRLERLLSAQPSLGALNDRLCLVDPLAPIAQQTCMAIEQLVSEQRQMIQGWCVALANLAEVTARAEKCLTVDAARLSNFETRAGDWEEKLNLVADLKRELSQVPLLPQLVHVLTDSWTQGQRTAGTSRTPSNLYDWVCLQITLSARTSRIPQTLHSNTLQVTIGSSPLSTVSRPRIIPGGRPRRTSAGNLDHSSLAGLIPGSPKNEPNVLHQMRGSQPSLGNLFAPCSPSPSLQQLSVNQDPQSDSIDEHDFLLVIESAKHDLNILLNGDESSSYAAYRASGDMPYTRYLTTRYSELLSLVPSCSAISPTGVDSNTSGNSNEKDARTSPPESSPVARVEFLDPETVALTRESLSGTDFSLLLARLEPVTEVAIQLFDRIQTVQRSTTAFYQRAMKTRDMSAITEQFPAHTSQLQELLNAFRQLCRILAETMESKLDLAENLHKRQCWLQNFQSYMHRVDASIQKCLSRMGRVARTTTLISQLQKAPEVYTRCLVEVVRQHEFETNYAQIIREQRISRSEEVTRRTRFARLLTDNILHSLFAPWTSSRGDRSNLSKNLYHGSTRNLNTPDSTENDPTAGRPDLRTPGKSAHDSQQWTRSQALGSRSEPRLNEMTGASSLVRTGSRGRPKETLRSMARKLVEVEEDENEHRSPESRISLAKTRASTDAVVRPREQTGMQRKGDSGARRISMPVGEPEPASPVWTLGENEEEVAVFMDQTQQSLCVTRDDLEHLSAVLPSHLADILHQELVRVLIPVNQTFLGCQPSSHELTIQPPVVRHVGLSPMEQSASIDAVTTDSHHSGDQEAGNWGTVDAACQTDFPSPVRRWDVHSQSTSLLIPGFGSPQRPHLTGWDPLPSSLCSWEFCPPNPPSRLGLLKRSASTNGLLEFTSTTAVKRTQTEDSATNTDDRVPPPDNLEAAGVEPVFLESLVSQPDDSPQENQPPETAPSPCSLPEDFASLVLEPIPTDDLYVDPEFATPTALMSSSFHSTQTNFSNAEEPADPPRDQLDKCLDELGATPTQAFGTVVEKPSFPSDGEGWSTPASLVNPQTCSCQLNKLHATCTDLLELFSSNPSILQTMSSSSGGDVGLLKQLLFWVTPVTSVVEPGQSHTSIPLELLPDADRRQMAGFLGYQFPPTKSGRGRCRVETAASSHRQLNFMWIPDRSISDLMTPRTNVMLYCTLESKDLWEMDHFVGPCPYLIFPYKDLKMTI
ncbi:hypothetical protein CSKR_106037 [Clonorchis sinensis]|uniref:Ubiquitin-like domain-containing protein n=1 Tax=Clonorchis sinensis TaxID=79923 RepID=A0A8T1N0L3_CLOSI|nr:hypothetical protein CSKR_106037 [Clonorchis sinensis]